MRQITTTRRCFPQMCANFMLRQISIITGQQRYQQSQIVNTTTTTTTVATTTTTPTSPATTTPTTSTAAAGDDDSYEYNWIVIICIMCRVRFRNTL